jgi:glycosyltransferase involved in cell wall biosynthesis
VSADGSLTVLSVAYPFAPVSSDPVGGAEQVLAHLDRALVARGHRSAVVAQQGSTVAGCLFGIPAIAGEIDARSRALAHDAVKAAIGQAVDRVRPDVLHFHGLDFADYLPEDGPPALVTLHLPLDWYPEHALRTPRPRTELHAVSESQAARAPAGIVLGGVIANGVDAPALAVRKLNFALVLGRICPEKGVEDAIGAARLGGCPLAIAGRVFPYAEHEAYFRLRIAPLLDRSRRFVGAVAGKAKWRLLARARCLLVPSKVAETSSLAAMEAIASGTPVIAYRQGALPDIVAHGRTGFIVETVGDMADAIRQCDTIDPAMCRMEARRRFSLDRMVDAYVARYRALSGT